MLVGLLHGLRVSEMLAIRGRDVCDGKLSVKRLKKSRATLHALRVDGDPLFDESPLLELAQALHRGAAATVADGFERAQPSFDPLGFGSRAIGRQTAEAASNTS